MKNSLGCFKTWIVIIVIIGSLFSFNIGVTVKTSKHYKRSILDVSPGSEYAPELA